MTESTKLTYGNEFELHTAGILTGIIKLLRLVEDAKVRNFSRRILPRDRVDQAQNGDPSVGLFSCFFCSIYHYDRCDFEAINRQIRHATRDTRPVRYQPFWHKSKQYLPTAHHAVWMEAEAIRWHLCEYGENLSPPPSQKEGYLKWMTENSSKLFGRFCDANIDSKQWEVLTIRTAGERDIVSTSSENPPFPPSWAAELFDLFKKGSGKGRREFTRKRNRRAKEIWKEKKFGTDWAGLFSVVQSDDEIKKITSEGKLEPVTKEGLRSAIRGKKPSRKAKDAPQIKKSRRQFKT